MPDASPSPSVGSSVGPSVDPITGPGPIEAPPAGRPALIDTHCHLDVAEFDADRLAVLAAARAAGVGGIVVPAIDAAGWPALLALCAGHADLWPALGLHPVYLDRHREADLDALESALAEAAEQVVAVGEIGLDHHAPDADRGAQRRLCAAQLAIARAARLPVLLHVRRAHDEMLGLLARAGLAGGIVHAFNGSLEQAERYLGLGFRLGFGGMLTFPRSTRLRRLARALPAAALVLETDAPDLTVASHQYQRNSPAYLPEVLGALAEVRDEPAAELAAITTGNARAVLGLGAGGRTSARSGDSTIPTTTSITSTITTTTATATAATSLNRAGQGI